MQWKRKNQFDRTSDYLGMRLNSTQRRNRFDRRVSKSSGNGRRRRGGGEPEGNRGFVCFRESSLSSRQEEDGAFRSFDA